MSDEHKLRNSGNGQHGTAGSKESSAFPSTPSWRLPSHPFPRHAAFRRPWCQPLSHGFHAPTTIVTTHLPYCYRTTTATTTTYSHDCFLVPDARAPGTQPLAPCTQPLCHLPTRHAFAPRCRHQAVLEWEEKEHERQQALAATSAGARGGAGGDEEGARFVAYVPLPDQQAIEAKILEMKRNDLLAKYTSEALLQQQANAKQLLNKK